MNAPIQSAMPTPMAFGQILVRIYRLLRSQLKLFIGLASLPAGAYLLLIGLVFAVCIRPILAHLPAQPDPAMILRTVLPAILILLPVQLAVFALYLAASIHAALQADQGLSVTFSDAYQVAWQRFGRYCGLMLLIYIIACLPALVMQLVVVSGMGVLSLYHAAPPPSFLFLLPLVFLLFFAALVYSIILLMRLSLAFPASLAENLTARAALSRSGQLTRGAKGRIFLVMLVIYALGYAAEMVGIFALAAIICICALILAVLHVALASVVGIIAAVLAALCLIAFLYLLLGLLGAAFSIAFAVLYNDQRLRKDGPPPALSQPGAPA